MVSQVTEAALTQAIAFIKQLEAGVFWKKLRGRKQRSKKDEKPAIVFKLPDNCQLVWWLKQRHAGRFEVLDHQRYVTTFVKA